MGHGGGPSAAQALGHTPTGVWDLVLPGLAAQLKHHFDGLVYASCAAGVAPRFQPAKGGNRYPARLSDVTRVGQPPALPPLREAAGLQAQRRKDRKRIVQFKDGNLVRVQGALNSLTVVPLPAAVLLFGAGLISLVGLGAGGLRNLRWPQA